MIPEEGDTVGAQPDLRFRVVRSSGFKSPMIMSVGVYHGIVHLGYQKHYRILHSDDKFTDGSNHINGIEGYDEPLFPVADAPIGKIGTAICYDWLFPEVLRQLAANGAEVLARVSAYMDPWNVSAPMDWWTIINRARVLENTAYVVAANQAASLKNYPPYSWSGGSQIVDYEGRLLADASPGPGERIVVAPVDVSALRHERETRRGHSMLAYLRTEAYPVYQKHFYPPQSEEKGGENLSYERNNDLIDESKRQIDFRAANNEDSSD